MSVTSQVASLVPVSNLPSKVLRKKFRPKNVRLFFCSYARISPHDDA